MAKQRKENQGSNDEAAKPNGEETVSGYFRKVFAEKPKLLDSRSNDELLARWLADHPGETEVPEKVRQNLSNVKSLLRKDQRKAGRKKEARKVAAGAAPTPKAPRRAGDSLMVLEEQIDDALTLAKAIDREGLQSVISHLRRARNEVVWKQGQLLPSERLDRGRAVREDVGWETALGAAGVIRAFQVWLDRLSQGPNYKWVVVGLLFFGGFLNLEDRVVIFSVMPLIRSELHLSDVFVGGLMSAFLWTYALCSPLAGYFGDRVSRQRVVVTCLALWSLVTVAAGLVTSPAQLMATRVLLAVTEAFYIPASLAIVADYHTPATRGKAVATLVVGMNLGPIVGGAVAGWIGDHYGWRPTLIGLGGAGLFLAIVLAVFLRDVRVGASDCGVVVPAPRRAGIGETIAEVVRTPSVVAIMLAVGLFSLAAWMLITWLPLFLYETFKMSLAQSGFFGNLAVTGPVFVGALLGGVFSDYVGAKRPKGRMLLLLAFYALAIPWPLMFSVASVPAMVLGSAFLFQLCRALGELNSHPLIFDLVSPEKRSTAVGISNCVNSFLGGVGALVVGEYRASLGFQAVFGLVPIVITLSVGGLLVAYFKSLDRDLKRRALPRV